MICPEDDIVNSSHIFYNYFYKNIILIFRTCHHIETSKENLKSLFDFINESLSISEVIDIITRSHKTTIIQRYVSYLLISLPVWCQFSTDIILNRKLFQSFSDIFQFDDLSCYAYGNIIYETKILIIISSYIIYISIMILQFVIMTVYCHEYFNTYERIDLNLSNYNILNWNNKMSFSYQFLNQYLSHLINSETSFNVFYYIIIDEYLSSESSVKFCDNDIFEYIWLTFTHLQEI